MNWRFHSVHSLFFVSAKIIENTFEVCTKFKQSKIWLNRKRRAQNVGPQDAALEDNKCGDGPKLRSQPLSSTGEWKSVESSRRSVT